MDARERRQKIGSPSSGSLLAMRGRVGLPLALALVLALASGCATVAEMRKLERRVGNVERSGPGDSRQAVADAAAEVDSLRREVASLRGRLEVAEKTASDALVEARRARKDLATRSLESPAAAVPEAPSAPLSQELRDYKDAYGAWRANKLGQCIDLFKTFLQTHSSSAYADDATFWLADCHFKQGDFKKAAIRFDDVVRYFPEGDKAPEALYREGEALLRLGHQTAAKKAFERVVKEYPSSARAQEAGRQLQVIGEG